MDNSDQGSLQLSDTEHINIPVSAGKGRNQTCKSCVWRESKPRLGHTLCSHHRACCQRDFWNPMDCAPCMIQLDRMKQMGAKELARTKAHFKKMLTETQAQFQDSSQGPWDFNLPAKIYFGGVGGFIQDPEIPRNYSEHPSVGGSVRDNTEQLDSDCDQFDQDDESVLMSLLNVSERQYASSSPEECTHYNCVNPVQGGGDCDDQIHKGKGKFKTTKKRPYKKLINYFEDRIDPKSIPDTASYMDLNLNQNYMKFDERIHRKVAPNKLEIVRCSDCTTYRERIQKEVIFKTGDQSLFQYKTEKDTISDYPYTCISTMKAALETNLQMEPSVEKHGLKYIHMMDTVIQHDSALAKLCANIKTMDKKTCSVASELNTEKLRKEFIPRENWNLNIMANFKAGWSLTENQSYFKFAKPEEISLSNFRDKVLLDSNQITISNSLLTTEKFTRLAVCNTFTSLHITEMLAKKLQEIPENIRAKYSITPAMLLGLNNHSLYTLKEQIITWMIAKMRVRRAVITNYQDDGCKRFIQSTLWDSELFPDIAFTNLSNANNGRTDFRNLLKLSNKRQYTEYDHEAKKRKYNFNQDFQFSPPFRNPNNSRGSTYNRARGGRKGGRR